STPYASSHSRPRAPPESYTLSLHDALPISVGLWPAWLAHRVLGHVYLLPGRELRHPWRRLRPDVSASRERDRPVRGGLGQAHGGGVDAQRPGAGGQREDVQVAGQLLHRARGAAAVRRGGAALLPDLQSLPQPDQLFRSEPEAGGGWTGALLHR